MVTSWRDVLAAAGFPTTAVVLDFETYWTDDYSLKKMSIVEYVLDPRFECTCLGWKGLDPDDSWGPAVTYPAFDLDRFFKLAQEKFGERMKRVTVVMQNAKFDALILQEHFGITPQYVVDVLDLAKMWDARGSHKLADLAEQWHAPSLKGDTTQFKGLHYADIKGEQARALAEYTINDVEIEAHLFTVMLPKVVSRPAVELPVANHTLQMYLKPSFQIDMDLGRQIAKGMRAEMQTAVDDLNALGLTITDPYRPRKNPHPQPRPLVAGDVSKDSSFKALVEAAGGHVPMKPGKVGMIPALSKEDEGLRELLAHPDARVRSLALARKAVQSWPLHIAKVESILAQAAMRQGFIGTPLGYHNAHTGRWGGAEGINLQNLGGRGRGGKGTHPLIQRVRNMLRAPKGYLLGINDYSKVEAVGLAWQADQRDLLEGFRTGADVYSDLASELFGFPVRKKHKLDPKPIAARLEVCRGFGKDAILGCGYGMGAARFYERCYSNDDLRPKFDDGTFDMEFIQKVIDTYRTKYSRIPQYWQTLEKSWRWSTKYEERVMLDECGLEFFHEDDATFIRLPSGRLQRYPHARVLMDNSLRYHWGPLWGGTLTENVISALCRDLIAEAILRLIDNGFWVGLTVHDEIVALLPETNAEAKLKEMAEIMCQLPAWAKGFPLSAEGELSECYKK